MKTMQLKTIHFKLQSFNDEQRTFQAVASTSAIDRHGETIDQASWNLDNFVENPVIPWGHDYDSPPVARATEIGVVEDKLLITVQFPMPGIYPFADTIYNLYRNGYLHAFSVGFIPMEYEPQTGTFSECELLEVSAVTVPANPEALALAFKSGVLDDSSRKMLIGQMRKHLSKLENDELNQTLTSKPTRKDTSSMSKLRKTTAALKDSPNLKAGATLSASTLETLGTVLDGIAQVDEIVDDLQPMLADLMGVADPDDEENAENSDNGDENEDNDTKAAQTAITKDNEDGSASSDESNESDEDSSSDGKPADQETDTDGGTNEDEIPEDLELTEEEQRAIADHVASVIEAEKAELTGKVI